MFTDVSKDYSALILRVRQSTVVWLLDPDDEDKTILQNISIYQPMCNIKEELNIQQYSCENLKSHNPLVMDMKLERKHAVVHICMSLLFITVYLLTYNASKLSLSLFCSSLLCLCLKPGCLSYIFLFQALLLPYLPSTVWSPPHKIQFAGTDLCRTFLDVLAKLRNASIRCVRKIARSGY